MRRANGLGLLSHYSLIGKEREVFMVDPYNKLRMEYNGIRSIINSYTSGSVICYLDGLKESINAYEKDDMLYYLAKINKWYIDNIIYIRSNSFVSKSEKREHSENMEMLESIYNELVEFDFSEIVKTNKSGQIQAGEKKIFLSHRSCDKKYADALEKLIIGLGVNNDQLIYTSHPLHKIPLGQKIYDYLRENINDQVFMIILWSNEYLESPACISEMGAAWVTQSDCVSIYTPEFSFGNPKYREVPVDTTKMGAVLNGDSNCKASMVEFKNKVIQFFGLENDEQKSAYLIDEFMNDIK